MKRHLYFLLTLMLCLPLGAQMSEFQRKEVLNPLAERLTAFGKTIPQEKVYIHMDNTCYFQGDTIWFAAYTRQTTDDRPSKVSGVLYVELLNQDGYLVERKMIEMKDGRGSGFFVLNNVIQYSGFYELRAYTRWQLNWGVFEHKHSIIASRWFASKELEHDFFRDYEKLYSRVFPVYDHPKEAGDYTRDMTLRTMRRYFRKDMDKQKPTLDFFPEGGNLVAGVENRVAFEATMSDGEWLKGSLSPNPSPIGRGTLGREDSQSKETPNKQTQITPPYGGGAGGEALSRGRGVFTIVPEKGKEQEVTFTTEDGRTVKAKLPKPEERGVALQVKQEGDSICIETHLAGLSPDTLGLTIMYEGKVSVFRLLKQKTDTHDASLPTGQSRVMRSSDWGGLSPTAGKGQGERLVVQRSTLPCGVNQVTIFDAAGHVYADRLFFVTKQEEMQPTLTVSGAKEEYRPYEQITLDVQGKAKNTSVSLAVRDGYQADALFDNASIMTEMLLSSEIRGFVPDPGWYFEKDDEEHRQALDLLMMTQGWRRFDWRDMAVKGEWDLTQPDEKTPVVTGRVYKPLYDQKEIIISKLINENEDELEEDDDTKDNDVNDNDASSGDKILRNAEWKQKAAGNAGILVHAEIANLINRESAISETDTKKGYFKLRLPRYYGPNVFFLSVSDTATWTDKRKNEWVKQIDDDDETMTVADKIARYSPPAKYYAHVSWPYPRFVKPYNFYQNHLGEPDDFLGNQARTNADGTRTLKEVAVHARHGGLRRFDDREPAMVLDAYEAVNAAIDAGVAFSDHPIVRAYLADYGLTFAKAFTDVIKDSSPRTELSTRIKTQFGLGPTRRGLPQYVDIPLDSIYHPKYLTSFAWRLEDMSPGERRDFNSLSKLDRIYIYTDYQPRLEGDPRYEASNLPETRVVVYPYPDGSRRAVYRDGRYIIQGFAQPAEFYSPDYSKQEPQEPTDYRRTLYWNPNLKLDAEGRARVTLYNNSRTTQIEVDAAGQAADGTLLWK